MNNHGRRTYEFGPFRLDPSEGYLLRDGQQVTLTPKAFEALVILVERHGSLIEKDELLKTLWPDTFVEEANLAHHVWRLRKALEDDGESFIQTVPKRGYRFVAPVETVDHSIAGQIVEQHTVTRFVAQREKLTDDNLPSSRELEVVSKSVSVRLRYLVLCGCAVIVLLALGVYITFRQRSPQTSATRITTLAVLPFKPLADAPGDPALEVGMTDALITRLSNLTDLTVRPTSAVTKYSSANEDVAKVGRQLRVESVLDGRVQRAGDRIRVTVQLIRTEDGKPLWAERFDEKLTDIFSLQDSLSEKVARALAGQLSVADTSRIQQRYTNSFEAYQSYLKGRMQMSQFAADGALKAIGSFQEAIDRDPNYALAYAGLADAHSAIGFMGLSITPREQFTKAKTAALKALELDSSLADPHTSIANILFNHEWNWSEAEREYKRAIELNPNSAEAHHWYSEYLQAMARWDEALAEIKRAQELDPLSLNINFHYGLCLFGMGRSEEALQQFRRTLDIDASTGASGSHWGIAMIYQQRGMHEEAIRELEEAKRLDPRPSFRLTGLATAYALAGRRKEATELLNQVLEMRKQGFVSPTELALLYGALGDNDEAFTWLNKAVDEREMVVVYFKVMELGHLRKDPRFEKILQRIGLV